MTRTLSQISLLLILGLTAPAAENNSNTRADFQSFHIIAERNIFNPNRSNRPVRSTRRESEPERRTRIETFALVGTMSYDKGRFAFFDSSNSDYRKAVQASDTIAGYTVAEVAPNHVKLESTNQPAIELRIGMQMRKRDDEAWRLSTGAESLEASRSSSSSGEKTEASSSPSSSPDSNSTSSAGASDVLKRLMEKRNQEFQNEKP